MKEETETKVDLKHSKSKFKIKKDITPKGSKYRCTYLVSNGNIECILKRFSIPLQGIDLANQETSKECLSQMSEAYKEYFLMKAASCFNPHIVKPLCLDYTIDLRDISVQIEIILECGGVIWSKWGPTKAKRSYIQMKQSASVFSLLHNIGVMDLNIKPDEVTFNFSEYVLKFIGMGRHLDTTIEQRKPEALDAGLAGPCVSIYSWVKFFCSMTISKEKSDLRDFTEMVKRCLNSIVPKSNEEEKAYEVMKETLINIVSGREKRLTLEGVVASMNNLEDIRDIEIKCRLIRSRNDARLFMQEKM
eukprot:TRINITY_DN17370_c0_g1_i1.p1 TRINITY_DN17370_c0_g1~~TRINITY_DN17370_c0_g1_i1.p1  ORF type:complete len:304 (+),score=15.19 TRINITY_DN17370_c0_g1_i1:50-961(+)